MIRIRTNSRIHDSKLTYKLVISKENSHSKLSGQNVSFSEISNLENFIPDPDGRSMYIGLDGVHSIASVPTSYYTTVTAVNQVMLVGFSVPDVPLALLRQSAIYEGGYTNGTYLGNLVNARSGQIYSTSNKLGVYTFGLEKFINQTVFMVLDSRGMSEKCLETV